MLGSILGGIAGNIFDNGDEDKQRQAMQDALKAIQGVDVPNIDEQKLALENYESAGELTPEMEAAIKADPSLMAGISTDPRLKDAQLQALTQMQQLGTTGLTSQDREALNQERRQTAQDANAQDQSILQNMASRGMAGGGAELAARLNSAQASANRAGQQGDSIASMAQQKALQAMAQAGSMGGQMQQQEFNQKSAQAQAQDAINMFNTQNRQSIGNTNVQMANQAQASNLANKQGLMNQNTQTQNYQQQYNKGLYQQQFNNQMNKAKGVASQDNNMANYYGQQAANTRGMWAGIGNGVDQGAAAAFGAMSGGGGGTESARPSSSFVGPMPQQSSSSINWGSMISDKGAKKDVSPADDQMEDFLDKLKPFTYKYKDPSHGEGTTTGVMAQDLEKSKVGSDMVHDTPSGLKAVDIKKSIAASLAAHAHLHERLKKLEGKNN